MASLGGHLTLFAIFVIGSAFVAQRPPVDSTPRINFYPSKLLDEKLSGGGGNPKLPQTDQAPGGMPQSAPEPPPATVEKPPPLPPPPSDPVIKPPEPPPPDPTPEKEPVVEPPPKVVTTPKPPAVKKIDPKALKAEAIKKHQETPDKTAQETVKDPVKTVSKKPAADIDFSKVITRNSEDPKRKAKEAAERARVQREKAQEEADRRAAEEAYANAKAAADRRKAAFQSSLSSLGSGFSNDKGVAIEVGGPGGEAYANYGAFVKQAYDNAWIVSQSLGDSDITTEISVTVLRSGEILSARITRRSGLAALDKTVETAISKVSRLRPFPEGARDEQRTFRIRFNLKAKRSTG